MSQKYFLTPTGNIASLLLALFFAVLVMAACGGAAVPDEAALSNETMAVQEEMAAEMMADDEAMAGKDEMAAEMMADDETMAGKDDMADEAMHDDEAMAGKDDMADETMAGGEAMDLPGWFETELTNVNTGQTFKITDFHGQVVLVETMAVWCSNCLRQQREVQALHELLGDQPGLVSVALDIDPNETNDILAAHTGKNGFDWVYAVAPAGVAREIGQLYGGQFLNPPATPMLIIDRQGQAHPLPFGHKTAVSLQEALAPFLAEAEG